MKGLTDHPMMTCPRCCEPYVELKNPHTYWCLYCKDTFNVASLGKRGQWVNADRWLRHEELRQGPVLELYGDPRPLTLDGTAELAWRDGRFYGQRGLPEVWVAEKCDCL